MRQQIFQIADEVWVMGDACEHRAQWQGVVIKLGYPSPAWLMRERSIDTKKFRKGDLVMPDFHALVPAAGFGARMGGELPKQYLPLAGKPMIFHALNTLCECAEITTVFVVLSPDDTLFHNYNWSAFGDKLQPLYCGGAMRSDTVLNGLLASEVEPDDWVLVHDAARPCLTRAHLAKLIAELRDDAVGGLLAVPVADTLKRADGEERIQNTESRENLWQAQTPQMFRAGLLAQALQQCKAVTDDASAIETLGLKPKLVLSDAINFKVTYPQDIRLAELLLAGKA